MRVSAVIPAYREAGRVGPTVASLRTALEDRYGADWEVLVVDDGSADGTAEEAEAAGARVVRLPANAGKGRAVRVGFQAAAGEVLLMVDADTGPTARLALELLPPVLEDRADMTIAVLPHPPGSGGLGLALGLARWGVRLFGGPDLQAPLSGQRALRRDCWERMVPDEGFGLEMGLNLDAVLLGLRVVEVPLGMQHRITGRTLAGYRHRGRQFAAVARAIVRRWRRRPRRSASGR